MAITTDANSLLYTDMPDASRVQRKTLVTIAEWVGDGNGSQTPIASNVYASGTEKVYRQVLGARTEDSSIEFNADIETTTDILGVTHSDVNKTEPQQDFDPFNILKGSALGDYLVDAAMRNDIDAYSGAFTIIIVAAFRDSGSSGTHAYAAVYHKQCSIIPTSLGGDTYLSMPIEVHLSNNLVPGTVDKLADAFTFTADT